MQNSECNAQFENEEMGYYLYIKMWVMAGKEKYL